MHAITIESQDKKERYAQLLAQLHLLWADEYHLTANLANTAAVLKEHFPWLWVGFYVVDGEELVLGPFQGPLACTRIAHGRGVCGQAWAQRQTLIVDDVNAHPDHIACSSRSRSEIVVPLLRRSGEVFAVLDADSEALAAYDGIDAEALEYLARRLMQHHGL